MSRTRGRKPGLKPDGLKIRRIRTDLGLSPGDLAKKIGRDRQFIYSTESTSRPISRLRAVQIARALGVEVSDIITDDSSDGERELAS
jgi:transcriptional regulator with XRE-family HTH domain